MRLFDVLLCSMLTCGLSVITPSIIEAEPVSLSGSFKSLNIFGEEAPAELLSDYRLSSNRARLEAAWLAKDNLEFNAAADYQYLWTDPAQSFNLAGKDFNRHIDLEKTYDHGSSGDSRLQLDRFNLKWRQGPLDIVLGRQAIGFGRILIFSPLDVIAPFAPDEIDTDVRKGIDALRTIFNYGLDGQLGAVAVWGREHRYDSLLGTWSDNRKGVDYLLIGGRLRGRNMLGAGIAGSLGTLGLKGELTVHRGRDVNIPGGDLERTYLLAAVETWYRFDNGLSIVAQYLYNGPGVDRPEEYPQVLASAPLTEGLTYLLGQHYFMVAPGYELHPLATLEGLVIINTQDESALFRPILDLSLSDNISLQLFWTMHSGDGPEIINSLLPPVPKSEFGMRGDNGGIFFKWFF